MFLLKVAMVAVVFYGSINTANLAWALGDVGVGLMAWLNIVGILIIFFLAKPTIVALKDYEEQQKQGVEEFTFNPVKLGIKNATYWEEKYLRKTGQAPTAEPEGKTTELPST